MNFVYVLCFLQGQDYEVRTYHQTNWVSTAVTGMEQEPAFGAGFNRLFKYIQRNNEKSKFCGIIDETWMILPKGWRHPF